MELSLFTTVKSLEDNLRFYFIKIEKRELPQRLTIELF